MALKLKAKARQGDYGSPLDCSALEAGDKVAVVRHRSIGPSAVTMYTVIRRTATLIICETTAWNQEERFRDDGSKVGDTRRPVLRAPFDPVVVEALEVLRVSQCVDMIHRATENFNPGHLVERDKLLHNLAGLVSAAQTDLLSIRASVVEWEALKGASDAVR